MIEMKRQDLEELYQLLTLYKRTYGNRHVEEIQKEVAERYERHYGKDIMKERNPRKAGRKRQYTEEDREKIRIKRGQGASIREIAKETGCSVGYVQGVLSAPKNRCSEINY